MAFFPRFGGEFSPLFRLLDDYASHSATRDVPSDATSPSLRSFTPKFDIKETKDSYEFHGELPGIEQKDIDIEFLDANTVHISGRVEHRQTRGQPPSGFIEGEHNEQRKIEARDVSGSSSHYHQPTVEDAEKAGREGNTTQKSVQKAAAGSAHGQGPKLDADGHRWWVTERSVGQFSRTFTLPSRVDTEKVKASLKNGILTVVLPKAAAVQSRKITID